MKANLILVASMLVPLALMFAILLGWRALRRRDRRRSPLNFKLLNLPGDGLRRQIEKHDEKINEAGMMVILVGPIMLAIWGLNRLSKLPGGLGWSGWDWLFPAAALVGVLWGTRDFIRHAKKRRRLLDGLAAERATAQNLMPLMAEGCIVFHDFPADGFNIDHIVVAPHAVYAVETKSRRKPATGGKAAARVGYDGRTLSFPDHTTRKPIEQAKAQAEWLQRFLGSAVGEPVRVIPVLALPGWYVELDREGSRAEVIVNNLRNPLFLLKRPAGFAEDPTRTRRIAHALVERYPNPPAG